MSQSGNCGKLANPGVNRRRFMKIGGVAFFSALYPFRCLAALKNCLTSERSLAFYNLHTREFLETTYWRNGTYRPEALAQINHIMRDHRTGEIKAIEPRLLDFLYSIKRTLKSQEPYHLISGYRSPKTNAYLRRHRKGVAKNSYHMYGKAADIRLPDCRLSLLRQAALNLHRGGVGYYPHSHFVHVDTGRFRCW